MWNMVQNERTTKFSQKELQKKKKQRKTTFQRNSKSNDHKNLNSSREE